MDANAADPSPARVTVEAALDAFIAKKQGERLSRNPSWQKRDAISTSAWDGFGRQ